MKSKQVHVRDWNMGKIRLPHHNIIEVASGILKKKKITTKKYSSMVQILIHVATTTTTTVTQQLQAVTRTTTIQHKQSAKHIVPIVQDMEHNCGKKNHNNIA